MLKNRAHSIQYENSETPLFHYYSSISGADIFRHTYAVGADHHANQIADW